MKINRENLLKDLQMVQAGLSTREFIEQSTCFVFAGGEVMTFNDEIACRKKIGFEITGAVQADKLLSILEKLGEPELVIEENEESGELEFRGKKKAFGVTKESQVFLPIDRVELPKKWLEVPADFAEAVNMVRHCVSTDETKFLLTCVHLHPDYLEACDNKSLFRYYIKTGLKQPVLVRGTALNQIREMGMNKMAITESWVHFKNGSDLIFSTRKYMEEYPPLESAMQFKGQPLTIPKGLGDAADRASVFAADKAGDPYIQISLKSGKLKVKGDGMSGWYSEIKKIAYAGPAFRFIISPLILKHISENYSDAEISQSKLRVSQGKKWTYLTVLGKASDNEKETPAAKEEEAAE